MKRRYVQKGIICKKCSCCGAVLPESEFNLRESAPDKLQYYCRKCNKEYCKTWKHDRKDISDVLKFA